MQIKSFKAPTLKEAMANVKSELGVDAVILHTNKIKKGGILGFHSKEIVEVIAAVEDAPAREQKTAMDTGAASEAVLQAAAAARASRSSTQGAPQSGVPVSQDDLAQPAANFTPRNMVSHYQTAGTLEAISQAMAQSMPSQTFGEVLASVNKAQGQGNMAYQPQPQGQAVPQQPQMQSPMPPQVQQPMPQQMPPAAPQAQQAAPAMPPQQPQSVPRQMPAPLQEPVPAPAEAQLQAAEQGIDSELQADVEPISESGTEAVSQSPADEGESGEENESQPLEDDDSEKAEPIDTKEQEIQDLQNQLAEMKSLLLEMSRGKSEAGDVPSLQRAMEEQGISKPIMDDMVSKLSGTEILAPKDSQKAGKALEKYIRKSIRIANGITLYSDKPKVVALIGPTGVGKTTTLAKIAARFVLEEGAKVALITADTYRISAVEQLKTYSDILGLPLEIVYDAQALQEAIDKHHDKQLILLDTAGRSQYNTYQMKELNELLDVEADIEKHLVMSATTKTSDGLELLENFSLCKPNRVIFTKVDETRTHGIILNILHRRKAALSYLTNGQSVPDDIEPASIEKLAELLLR